jgi:excisionase family DNA binding protein
MQGDRSVPTSGSARLPTLADLIAAGELTCSAAQVAHFLNVSKPTVIAAARRGELPGRQVGKQWRFSCKELAGMFGERHSAGGGDADAA